MAESRKPSDPKKLQGYVPLTYHKTETPRLHYKPVVPYHKFMSLEQRVEKCRQSFGSNKTFIKGQGYIDNGAGSQQKIEKTIDNSKEAGEVSE
jgi:hypothetical protein